DAHLPIARTVAGIAFEDAHRQDEVLVDEILPAVAEEVGAVGPKGAHTAGDRELSHLQKRVAGGGDNEELIVSPDRVIALEDILIGRIEDASKAAGFGAIAGGESDAPSIGDRKKIILRKRAAERRSAGVPFWRDRNFRRRLIRHFWRRRNFGRRLLLQRH